MGHEIPIFFVAIEKPNVPERLHHWNDAATLLGELASEKEKNRLYSITSRGWWHLYALKEICHELNIIGLEFTALEIVLLEPEQLVLAQKALEILLEKASLIPTLQFLKDSLVSDVFRSEFDQAVQEAKPYLEFESPSHEYPGAVGFWSFVKSLQAAIQSALTEQKWLLYVQPQP